MPSLLCLLSIVVLLSPVLSVSTPENDTYIGAVVEYHRIWDPKLSPRDNVMANVKQYVELIEKAKTHSADIIVFPEMGLQTSSSVFVPIPDPKDKETPRSNKNADEVMRKLSEAAHNSSMYVVANILEQCGSDLRYNTDAVFDRNGTVIARYRKFNLYKESYVNRTKKPEYSYFNTDFGVRFGLFTCFDILFSQPALQLIKEYEVTDAIFPTAWFSQMPFLTAIQAQASWSYGTGANLLAAGLNSPHIGHTGSGLYAGKNGPIGGSYKMVEKDTTVIITAKIPKVKGKLSIPEGNFSVNSNMLADEESLMDDVASQDTTEFLNLYTEDLKIYKTELLAPPYDSQIGQQVDKQHMMKHKEYSMYKTVCQKDFCCDFQVNFTMDFGLEGKDKDMLPKKGDEYHYFRYRFAVLDGVRDFNGEGSGGIRVCGIIPCLDEKLSTCGKRADFAKVERMKVHDDDFNTLLVLYDTKFAGITINSSFSANDSFAAPNALFTFNQPNVGNIPYFGSIPGPKQLNFTKDKVGDTIEAKLVLKQQKQPLELASAGLYGRVFFRDGQPPSSLSSTVNPTAAYMLALTLLTAIFVGWPYLVPYIH